MADESVQNIVNFPVLCEYVGVCVCVLSAHVGVNRCASEQKPLEDLVCHLPLCLATLRQDLLPNVVLDWQPASSSVPPVSTPTSQQSWGSQHTRDDF